MLATLEDIKKDYPLHLSIWNNNVEELKQLIQTPELDREKIDPRGCTPLMLAVKLSNLNCVKCLLAAKCNANYEFNSWSIVQEAVCTGNEEILTAIIEVRDLQRHIQRVTHVPQLLQHLLDAPDFYIEMKWEFTSWVPLMSRLCPSDTYKVYKRGANVRIDTTLIGFDNNTWQRGNRSYIFKGSKDTATMIEIDHDIQEVMVEELSSEIGDIVAIPPPIGAVRSRLNAPVITNSIEMEKISFERNKSGIWGWRSEKSEVINGYNCKVYGASNVEFVTKTRMDHLSDEQIKSKTARTPLHSFLGIADDEYVGNTDSHRDKTPSPATPTTPRKLENGTNEDQEIVGAAAAAIGVASHSNSSCNSSGSASPMQQAVTVEEYFSDIDLNGRDIGRPKKINTKIQRFKANLWLSETYPIRLQEQVLPILDLMSTMASPHVSKLKDFITMQLPAGFPVKVEIPLFHVFNACITFGNVFGMTSPVENVATINEEDRVTCIVDDRCFDIPSHYVNRDSDARRQMPLDEDDMLQYAIEQSLVDTHSGTCDNPCASIEDTDKVDIWEALRGQGVGADGLNDEDEQLQRSPKLFAPKSSSHASNKCATPNRLTPTNYAQFSGSCGGATTGGNSHLHSKRKDRALTPTPNSSNTLTVDAAQQRNRSSSMPTSSSANQQQSNNKQFKNDIAYMKKIFKVLQESLCRVNDVGAAAAAVAAADAGNAGTPVSDEDDDDGGFRYIDADLAMALRLSRQDQQLYELELQREQEMLEAALKLSLQEH